MYYMDISGQSKLDILSKMYGSYYSSQIDFDMDFIFAKSWVNAEEDLLYKTTKNCFIFGWSFVAIHITIFFHFF